MVCSDSERIAHGPFRRASSFGADHERLRVLVRRRQALDDAARRPRMGYPGRPPRTGGDSGEGVGRELFEEAAAEAERLELFAYEEIVIHAPKPENYRYPYPASYQVFYCGRVGRLHPLDPTIETHGRGFFGPEEARQLEWIERHRELYDAALERMLGR